jgi:rRNA maturation endonuclease Nob1
MNVAYLFTFFLVVLIVLFLLLPFFGKDKSTFTADSSQHVIDDISPEDIPLDLGRDEAGYEDSYSPQSMLAEYEMEIEVAVQRARQRKSTFSHCSGCGHQLQSTDRFCPSCGQARQSS